MDLDHRPGRRAMPLIRRVLVAVAAVVLVAQIAPSPAAARPLESGGWTTDARGPSSVPPGGAVDLVATVTSGSEATALVDVEVYDAQGQRLHHRYWDQQQFAAGEQKAFGVTITAPSTPQTIRVAIGVFRTGWGVLHHWNASALTVEVVAGAPTPTTVAPTTTAPSTTTTTSPATTTSTTSPATTTTTAPDTGPVQFLEDFSTPAGFFDRFRMQVHHRADSFVPGITWQGDHNSSCEGPTTTRTVRGDVPADSFYWCAPAGPESGHVMTSMGNMAGYSIVAFAPDQIFEDVTKVCFDVNLTAMSRKWFEAAIVPEDVFQRNGETLAYVSPGAEEVDQTASRTGDGFVVLEGTGGAGLTINRQKVVQDPVAFDAGADRATRFTHCFWDNGDGTVTMTQERDGGRVVELSGRGAFPEGPVRVIFKDHSYDAGKGGGADHGTWHWDNILIE